MMGLVDYKSSEEEEGAAPVATESLKRKRSSESSKDLPPLPSKFHDLYASTTRISTRDDPSLHGGRKRVTPHIQGNWPSHLFIEWYPSIAEHDQLTSLISSIQDAAAPEALGEKIESSLTSDLDASLPLHISLSRPIGFPTDRKDIFMSTLTKNIERCGVRPYVRTITTLQNDIDIYSFKLSFLKLSWVSNFDNSRWFLVLSLEKPDGDCLNKLLKVCNKTVVDFGQLPLYAESTGFGNDYSDSFHISIGWTLIPPSPKLIQITSDTVNLGVFTAVGTIRVEVEDVKAKVGNIVTSIKLPLRVTEGMSLFSEYDPTRLKHGKNFKTPPHAAYGYRLFDGRSEESAGITSTDMISLVSGFAHM